MPAATYTCAPVRSRRDRAGRARGVGQRHRVGRPDRVAGGERGRDERQQREDEDQPARPAGEQRAAWRASPRRAQVVPELGEDGVGVARAHVAALRPELVTVDRRGRARSPRETRARAVCSETPRRAATAG